MVYHRGEQGLGTMEEDREVGDHRVQQGLPAATQQGAVPPATGAHANCSLQPYSQPVCLSFFPTICLTH